MASTLSTCTRSVDGLLKGKTEDHARCRPLLGKRLQRPYRSRVSQLSGPLVERDHVARSLTVVDLISQAHHRVGIAQIRPLFEELNSLVDAVLLAAPVM